MTNVYSYNDKYVKLEYFFKFRSHPKSFNKRIRKNIPKISKLNDSEFA